MINGLFSREKTFLGETSIRIQAVQAQKKIKDNVIMKGKIMIEYLSRREFIGKSAFLAGGALGSLTIARSVWSAENTFDTTVRFFEKRGDEGGGGPRILVAYASRCGSTGGVAGAIAGVLGDNGASVDVLQVENVRDVSSYQAIIVGSAIHSDRWLPEAVDFVKRNRSGLAGLPVAYFVTCLTMVKPTPENRQKALGFLAPLREAVPEVIPVGTGLFAGTLDYDRLSFMVRMVMKMKMASKGVSEGDYRDWESIKSWARNIGGTIGAKKGIPLESRTLFQNRKFGDDRVMV